MFDTTAIPFTTYIQSTQCATQDTGDNPSLIGQWVTFQVNNVIGVPNVRLSVRTSPDGVNWELNTFCDGNGNGSPLVNSVGVYSLLFQSANRYWAPIIEFYANDPTGGSGNSSSSSGESIYSSSSAGGTAAISLRVGLTPSKGF